MAKSPPSFSWLNRPLRGTAWAAAGLWLALALLWLAHVIGHGGVGQRIAHTAGRWLLPPALLAAVLWLALLALRRLRPAERTVGLALLAVLATATLVGFTGLAHEVGHGYYTDEGHYLHHARRIDSGDLFVRTMIYPHFTYHLDAFALWLADLHPGATKALAAGLYGVEGPAVDWLVLRMVTAGLGVLAVLPVFLVARRAAGPGAALVASGLMIFSAHYHEGFHVNICDVPSATLAAFCLLFVDRLFEGETTGRYLAAGLFAGLAAAAKYPAGVVAVAIVAAWGLLRLRERRWGWGLLWSGLLALGVFLAFNPSLFVYPQETLWGPRGIFFGVRQYGEGGWIGVTPASNGRYYLAQLAHNFGWAVAPAALLGLLGLSPASRRRLAWLLPFPLAYLLLIGSMSMVVVRNLFPVVPPLAILLGTTAWGLVPLGERLAARLGRGRILGRRLAAVLLVAVLALPAWRTGRQALAMGRASTREAMIAWMEEHVPRGAGILKESYTPNFAPVWFRTVEQRFALRLPESLFDDPDFDFLLLSGQAHGRFFRPEHQTPTQAAWYEAVATTHHLVHRESPGPLRLGPELTLYRLEQPSVEPLRTRRFTPDDAFLPNAAMRQSETLRFQRDGQFALFRAPLAAGSYSLKVEGEVTGGHLLVRDLQNAVVAQRSFDETPPASEAAFELDRGQKVFLYLYLGAGSRVSVVDLGVVDLALVDLAVVDERPVGEGAAEGTSMRVDTSEGG